MCALIAVLSMQAQTQLWDGSKAENSPIVFGAQAGLNVSSFTGTHRWDSAKVGFNVGVTAEKQILNSLGVRAGLFYTMKGSKGKNDAGFGGDLKTTFNANYIEIPIQASYLYDIESIGRLAFDFGPYFAFGVGGKRTTENTGNGSYSKPTKTEGDTFDLLNKFDFGLQFGPRLVTKQGIMLQLAYEISLTNVWKDGGGTCRNSNFMVNVGYQFKL